MKFLEINNRTCINVDEICWVENSEDGLTCTVYSGNRDFFCDVPYKSFVNMIKQAEPKESDNFHFAG